MEKNEVIHIYCANNARRIHKIVDKILKKFGGITMDDHEECYGIAYEVFTNLINSDKYDPSRSFDGWFYMCVSYRIKSYITKKNRHKRCQVVENKDGSCSYLYALSLDSPVSSNADDEDLCIKDVVASDFDTWNEVSENSNLYDVSIEHNISEDIIVDPKIKEYLSRLTRKQRKVVCLLIESYKPHEIRETLHLSQIEYEDILMGIRSYEKIEVLL